MDVLTNKRYNKYEGYTSRYTTVPYYYNTVDEKDIYGLGSNLIKTTNWYGHKVTKSDTLENLALKYYNNPTYWWIIAFFNDINDSFDELFEYYDILKIPNFTEVTFGFER